MSLYDNIYTHAAILRQYKPIPGSWQISWFIHIGGRPEAHNEVGTFVQTLKDLWSAKVSHT